jgi:hypothetical protein
MDLYCQVCGEPWCSPIDDMEPDEYQAFLKGDGCPCCPDGFCPECSGHLYLRRTVLNQDQEVIRHYNDNPPWSECPHCHAKLPDLIPSMPPKPSPEAEAARLLSELYPGDIDGQMADSDLAIAVLRREP